MTETIAGRPFWQLVYDQDGDVVNKEQAAAPGEAVGATGITDLVMFSHGWNNGQANAIQLYRRWFTLLAAHIDPKRTVGFVGVFWPSQLWRDEPIPNAPSASARTDRGGAATLRGGRTFAGSPTLDPEVLADLKGMFGAGAEQLDAIADLLAGPADRGTLDKLFVRLREFDAATADADKGDLPNSTTFGMLGPDRVADDVFATFAGKLAADGVEFGSTGGGQAGIGDSLLRKLNGAKELLRQLTYWKMKNRAGVVGRKGLGATITELAADHPELRVHLIGHSFGGRLVANALDGIPDGPTSPIRSITLLQAAFSRFAFTDKLPFDVRSSGALAGRLSRLDGPMAVCYSTHDSALGTMYPLASLAVGDAAAASNDVLARYRAMGSHGAYDADRQSIGAVGTVYPFQQRGILNIDASGIVTEGGPPSGAHSDIFKPELAWVTATAARLTT